MKQGKRVFGLIDNNSKWVDFVSATDELEASKLFGSIQSGLTIQVVSHPGNEYANLEKRKDIITKLLVRLEEAAIGI